MIFKAGHNFNKRVTEEIEADAAVIGSGAGGAVAAKELAEMGYKVVLLEEGSYFKKEKDFNLNPIEAFQKMYRQSGQHITIGTPKVMLPVGCTVGGSTTIFSGTCLRIPPRVLRQWKLQHGIKELDEQELELIYKSIEEYLFVKRADPEVAGENARLFLDTAREKLGLSGGWLPRAAKDCEGYGACTMGCPSGSKQSMDVSYVPGALEAGAVLYSRCRAERVIVENDKASGVEATLLDETDTDGTPKRLLVRSKVVVLGAGTIFTPLLLLKQGICNSSGMVGQNLCIHPGVAVIAEMNRHIGNSRGIPQSSYVDEFEADGIMLEGGTVLPAIHALSLPYNGKKHRDHMNAYPNTGIFGAMVSETESTGSVGKSPLGKYRALVKYNLKGIDIKKVKLSVIIMAQIWFAAGAKKVISPIVGYRELTGPGDLASLQRAKLKSSDFTFLGAFHPMGTCRMGTDPEYSVVKHTGETWDVKDLYIVDGSVMPTSLGVNPMLTICSLAMRATGFIDERLGAMA